MTQEEVIFVEQKVSADLMPEIRKALPTILGFLLRSIFPKLERRLIDIITALFKDLLNKRDDKYEFITTVKEHPSITGILSSVTGMGFSLVGLLSEESTVRIIGSIGGLCGIVLTVLSIYFKIKSEIRKSRK